MRTNFLTYLTILLLFLSNGLSGTELDSLAQPKLWLEQQNELAQQMLKDNKDFKHTVDFFKVIYDFATKHHLLDHFPDISIGYGMAMYKSGNIQIAHTILEETMPKIDQSNLRKKAEISQILGMTLIFQDKFPEGYKYQVKALGYFSELKDSTGLMSVYYDIGSNFGTQGQWELALENYESGIEIAKSLNDTKQTILGITSLASAWASLKNYNKALKYSKESIDLAKAINDDEELAWASIHRGHILGKLEKFEEAVYYLKQAYQLSFEIGNKLLTAYSLEQLSDINIQTGQLEKAIASLDESSSIYQELGQTYNVKDVTKKYAEIYFQQENYTKYKEYTDKYIALKDSLYSKEMMASMASLKQDFEVQKMERENKIALLMKDQEIAKAKNFVSLIIVIGAVVIFILLLILMYNKNKAAIEKNDILSAKNAEILRQNEFLANSNRDLEKFAYIISHDLKEPLRNINGFTKLLSRKLRKYDFDPDINEYAQFIINGTHQMAELLNGLLEYSKVSVNKSQKEACNIEHLVHKVVNGLRIQIDEKNCQIHIGELPTVDCRKTQIFQVFQNLLTNAIKYGPNKGNEISIGVKDMGREYYFYVKDRGIGIAPEYQNDIFVVFKRLHDRGTFSGSGIGLATCKKIVEEHGGKIWVKSQVDKGSCFYFTLPKHPIMDVLPSPKEEVPNEALEMAQ